MCELLGMSANTPTDLCFSFTGLTRRGGDTGPHRDGWGVAFYDGKGVRLFHDPVASASSPVAELVQSYPIKSRTTICHIRQANQGEVCLANTHPFVRERWGRYWTFAHNGQVPLFPREPGPYEPVGETDSELLFCDLMNRTHYALPRDSMPEQLAVILVEIANDYASRGVFNCLLSNGDWLFTYCSTKMASITRRAPFGPAQLKDADVTVDFSAETTSSDIVTVDIVTVIATEPLTTDENWEVYQPGEWKLWQMGDVIAAAKYKHPFNLQSNGT